MRKMMSWILNKYIFEAPCEDPRKIPSSVIGLELSRR